jgi:hypothetical protein
MIFVLMNYQVVVALFLGLVAVAGLIELPVTEDRTAEKVAGMVAVAEITALQLGLVDNS